MKVRVRFAPSGREVHVDKGTTLFEAAQAAGLPVGSSCGADGTCGKCGLRILAGPLADPSERELRVAQANRLDPALRLSCMVGVEDDLEVTADYW